MLTLAIPTGLAIVGIFFFANIILPGGNSFHTRIIGMVAGTLAAGVGLAAAGVAVGWCLGVVMLSPWVAVVAYEVRGHVYLVRLLQRYGIPTTER